MVSRKTQILGTLTQKDLLVGRGTHHLDRIDLIDKVRQKYLELSYDLNSLPEFRQVTGIADSSRNNLDPELHMNGLPFGHKFGPLDLAQYVNLHFGIESESENKAWEYLAHLKMLEQSSKKKYCGLGGKKRLKLFRRR